MIIYDSRRRRSRFGLGQYALTWLIPAAILAVIGFAVWPLLAFRHHWTTVAQVPCALGSLGPPCTFSPYSGTWTPATWTQVQQHSGPTGLGAGLTVAWIGFWFLLVMYGSITGRRQKARRG